MKNVFIIYAICFVAFLLFVSIVVYITQNGWWSLMVITLPIVIGNLKEERVKKSKEDINEDYN